MSVPAHTLNQGFLQKIATREGQEKTASEADAYIRDRLRESAYCRSILDVKKVERSELQVSTEHDTLVKIIEVEPRTRAMSLTFRGQPDARYFNGPRLAVGFYRISSEKLQKTEEELMAYAMPITQVVEDNSLKDLQDIEDREFTIHGEAAVQAMQYEAHGNVAIAFNRTNILAGTAIQYSIVKGELAMAASADDGVARFLQRPDLVRLRQIINSRRLLTDAVLMTESDLDGVNAWTVQDWGNDLQSETAVDGYKKNTLLGLRLVRTIKTDLLRRGNIYSFTAPKYFGRMFILTEPKFWIDKQANVISMECWENIGMVLANVASIGKLELYSGDSNPLTNANSILTQITPVDETQIGALNNRVEQGIRFPKINVFS